MFTLLLLGSTLFMVSRANADKKKAVSQAVQNDAAMLGTHADMAQNVMDIIMRSAVQPGAQPLMDNGAIVPAEGATQTAGQFFGPIVALTPQEVLSTSGETPPIIAQPPYLYSAEFG